jgi:hypothetical protein
LQCTCSASTPWVWLDLRLLSADCRALLAKAGDLVEVNVLEDPVGAVFAHPIA